MPTLSLSGAHTDLWEITIADLPAPVTKLTASPAGLYIEAGRLRWDLIPWPELAALIDDGPGVHQQKLIMQTRQELLRRILAMPGVVAMAGPLPEPVRITCEPDGIW
ncbi:MAG TPA: hypothetical protein PK170_07995 [Anaerolineae bacterium]|nr:hypothetical protein [Anaerolineae bacterium]